MASSVNRVLWAALMASQVVYLGVAWAVDLPPAGDIVPMLWPILAGLSLAIALGTVFYRRRALVEPIRTGAIDLSTPEGLLKAQQPFMLNLVLSESIGIYGLLLALLSGDVAWMLGFGSAAVALLGWHRPTAPDLQPPLGAGLGTPPPFS